MPIGTVCSARMLTLDRSQTINHRANQCDKADDSNCVCVCLSFRKTEVKREKLLLLMMPVESNREISLGPSSVELCSFIVCLLNQASSSFFWCKL